jgi:hypothetical protein
MCGENIASIAGKKSAPHQAKIAEKQTPENKRIALIATIDHMQI